ncbi:MAG: phosphatidylserine/phosphatidylglycerophosphate/cardiolipin synthase family protein, partial [Bacteriovoracaceae bacterium]|nr:phosphatidylserine/phosphatidylglycerophosphate/cardiolipin synthase family protein [Bacteriovoracaceae bacterium]
MKYSIILIFLFITPFNLYGSTQLERIFGDGQNYNVLDMRGQQNARNGNSLSLIDNGYDLYKKRFELIHNAKKTIYISGLSLQDNEGGVIILRYLCWAGQKGVEVKILLDHFVSKKIQKYRKWLREDCGVKLVFFNPMRWGYSKIFTSLHEKLFLVDGEYGLIGGNGYSDNYLEASRESNRWHDLEMSISGPIVCQMQRVYAKTWKNVLKRHRKRIDYYDSFGDNLSYEEKRDLMSFEFDLTDPVKNCYEKKKGSSNAVFLYNDPFFNSQRSQRNSSPTLDFYRKSILGLSPGELVSLYSPYMVPGKEFLNILIKAVKKGIKVRVLTNSDSSNDESGIL